MLYYVEWSDESMKKHGRVSEHLLRLGVALNACGYFSVVNSHQMSSVS